MMAARILPLLWKGIGEAFYKRLGDLYGNRKACARRTSGGQKRPSGAFLERGRVPDGAPRKAATNVAAFLLHHSLRDGLTLRASARVRLAGTGR